VKEGLKTPDDVKREFQRAGISIREWARKNAFDHQAVYGVLNGRFKGSRGNSHRIAVALGLKDGHIVKTENLFPVQEAA
jgi:gp16 family phage-associated protein